MTEGGSRLVGLGALRALRRAIPLFPASGARRKSGGPQGAAPPGSKPGGGTKTGSAARQCQAALAFPRFLDVPFGAGPGTGAGFRPSPNAFASSRLVRE